MTDILLGQSYYLRFDPKLWRAMQPYPPLGTLWAAACLRERGYRVALFDAMLAESEREWADALDRERPRFAIVYEDSFNYLSKMCLLRMRQAGLTMAQMARARGCTVIVCGSDATDQAAIYLTHGADVVIRGEGEVTLGTLLDVLTGASTATLADVEGVAFLDGAGRVVETPDRGVLRRLDALPLPAWDLVDLSRYRRIWRQQHGYFSVNMATTRGCPFHCNWCAKPIWGQTYNTRSPEQVVEEMTLLRDRYRAEHIWFADDIMGLQPRWLERFADLVEAGHMQLPYKCLSRADLLLRGDEIDALRRSGCQTVWVGAESGSQKILDAMEKGTRVDQIREVARRLKSRGIRVGFFLQFGYPGETLLDIEATRALVRSCRPDEIGISVSYPLPGTAFHARIKERLGEKQHWHDSDDLDMMYEGPYRSDFYRQLYRVVQKEFRLGKAVGELGTLARRPHDLRPRHLRRLGAAMFHMATLPRERGKLDALGRAPNEQAITTPPHMTHEASATPTPQDRDATP